MRPGALSLSTFSAFPVLAGQAWPQGDPAQGKASYDYLCATCHGSSGRGDGPAAASLVPRPTDLQNKRNTDWLKDDYLRELIKEGGLAVGLSPLMPALGGALNDDEVENVIGYVRSLAK